MTKTINVRMRKETYANFRRHLKPNYKETAASYFERLEKYLQSVTEEVEEMVKNG